MLFKISEHEGNLVMLLPEEARKKLNVTVGDEVVLIEKPNGFELQRFDATKHTAIKSQ
jgi:bifunctional DNA-binding transcriptional regulator/antitoxin component of YhaV-PrlF toxin-antitoxin module